jgi:(4S)-4-hydroxy-5-phosphonooxypentane-2,3-dione isomerase
MEESNMRKSAIYTPLAIALLVAGTLAFAPPSPPARAQSAATFVNAVDLDIAPAEMDTFLAAIKENGAASVKEPGCRQFDILVLANNPNHVFLYEVYDNEAAYQAHRQTDHFKKYFAATGNMITQRNVRGMKPIAFNAKAH